MALFPVKHLSTKRNTTTHYWRTAVPVQRKPTKDKQHRTSSRCGTEQDISIAAAGAASTLVATLQPSKHDVPAAASAARVIHGPVAGSLEALEGPTPSQPTGQDCILTGEATTALPQPQVASSTVRWS